VFPELLSFRCAACGYGASRKTAPKRCPMCGRTTWTTDAPEAATPLRDDRVLAGTAASRRLEAVRAKPLAPDRLNRVEILKSRPHPGSNSRTRQLSR
jgi:rubredoxin